MCNVYVMQYECLQENAHNDDLFLRCKTHQQTCHIIVIFRIQCGFASKGKIVTKHILSCVHHTNIKCIFSLVHHISITFNDKLITAKEQIL